MFRKNKETCNFEVHLVDNEGNASVKIKAASEEDLLTALAVFVNHLREDVGIEEHKLKFALNLGLKRRKDVEENIQLKEIHISKENEDELKKLLDKLMRGER